MLRHDLHYIFDLIPPSSRVLDLGCGDGRLLNALITKKSCTGYGVELDSMQVLKAMKTGINIIQGDLENGLDFFKDDSFDVIVLSQTIQAMKNTETILMDMMRVAQEAIVTFPNFGFWKNRLQITLGGHMPVSESMPYQWYNTPNIHWCTLEDFDHLCAQNQLNIIKRTVMTHGKTIQFLPNLLGSLAVYHVGK